MVFALAAEDPTNAWSGLTSIARTPDGLTRIFLGCAELSDLLHIHAKIQR